MKVPNDVICGVCKKVFCCAECRYKHEIKTHAIIAQKPKVNGQKDNKIKSTKFETTNIYLFCPICERKPMPLQKEMYAEMLAHVEEFHLPLRCHKCEKIYNRIDDLQNFTKCTPSTTATITTNPICCDNHQTCDTISMQKEFAKITISTQTSPQRQQINEFNQTPISLFNLRWKAKSKLTTQEEFVSDSVSSLKNISSICNGSVRRSLDALAKLPKGQLVRTTSTPVHAEILYTKHTDRAFNASGGQVSSIHNSANEFDNQSPAIPTAAVATTTAACQSPSNKQHMDSVNRLLKVGSARTTRMTAVTPLRQVMSKSIQKAFAEHGGLPTTTTTTGQRLSSGGADLKPLSKKIFDFKTNDGNVSPAASPLDLRLSPVVRRTHHEIHTSQIQASNAWIEQQQKSATAQNFCHEVLRSSQKITTTESIVITRTQHMTSIESAANSLSNDNFGSYMSAFNDKSLASSMANTTYNSAVSNSTSGSGSVYKSCQSIEIITATTAMSDIQQNYCDAMTPDVIDNGKRNDIENVVPTRKAEAQVISNNNLQPITPITRIPGALINKKLIRFDSPYEEDELAENSVVIENNENKKNCASLIRTKAMVEMNTNTANAGAGPKAVDQEPQIPLSTTDVKFKNKALKNVNQKCIGTPLSSKNLVSKSKDKLTATPLSTNTSVCEAFFTPNATPIRGNDIRTIDEGKNKLKDFNKFVPPSPSKPLLRKNSAKASFERSKNLSKECNENDEVSQGKAPKCDKNQNCTPSLGRSWSFSAILGSMMRLPSTKSKTIPSAEKVKTPSPKDSNSLIKRCASLAGSLVRSHSMIDTEKELRQQKRKRSYTTDGKLLTNASYENNSTDSFSTTIDNTLRTKRLRIHGRKPIERMRKNI